MARVTVEDCIERIDNRFDLVLLASHRSRMISNGASLTVERDKDKNPVVALREIADETVSPEDLNEELIHSLQKYVEVDEPDTEETVHLDDQSEMGPLADLQPNNSPEIAFDQMSEEELLRGLESLVPPEKSDDY